MPIFNKSVFLKLFYSRYHLDVKITVPDDYHSAAVKYVECFSLNKSHLLKYCFRHESCLSFATRKRGELLSEWAPEKTLTFERL